MTAAVRRCRHLTLVDFLLFMFFSVFESSAVFYMMFKVFKIDIYPIKILFVGLVCGFISYDLRTVYHISGIDVLVQMFLSFCFVWLMFRVHIFYSLILIQMTFLTYFLIQTLYYFLMQILGLFDSFLPSALNISTYILQIVSALTAFIVGWIVSKKRKGFDFVPDKPTGKVSFKTKDKILFVLNIPSGALMLLTFFSAAKLNRFFIIIPFLYAAMLALYLYYAYKKDRGEDDHIGI